MRKNMGFESTWESTWEAEFSSFRLVLTISTISLFFYFGSDLVHLSNELERSDAG